MCGCLCICGCVCLCECVHVWVSGCICMYGGVSACVSACVECPLGWKTAPVFNFTSAQSLLTPAFPGRGVAGRGGHYKVPGPLCSPGCSLPSLGSAVRPMGGVGQRGGVLPGRRWGLGQGRGPTPPFSSQPSSPITLSQGKDPVPSVPCV